MTEQEALVTKLVTDFKRHDTSAHCQIGKCSIFLQDRYLRGVSDETKVVVEVGVNWPACGTVDPDAASQFATDLQAAALIASATEAALVNAGYLIWRNVK